MILVCPLCRTRYLVHVNLFAAGSRQVRCARCKHSWVAETPREIEAVGALPPETAAIPEHVAPIPEGSNLPAVRNRTISLVIKPFVRQLIIAGILFVFFAYAILDRQSIAKHHPALEPIYNAIGLYIYYPGDGLEFDGVRSELKFDGGITKLVLDGKIKNKTKNNQKVPNILAEALGSDGHVIQSWQIDAPAATLAPEEEASFTSSMNAPKGTVVNVNLNFAEMKDDN